MNKTSGGVTTFLIKYYDLHQLLPLAGLEPARPKRAQRPQRGTSTNFVTRAVLPYSVLGKVAQVKVCICSKG